MSSFGELVRYVMSQLRTSEERATLEVERVLKAGLALRRIARTPDGNYRLVEARPSGAAYRVREPHSGGSTSSSDSE